MRKVIEIFVETVKRVKIIHFVYAAIITIVFAIVLLIATRDRSYNDYPIDAVIEHMSALEIIYDGNKKVHIMKDRVEIDKKPYVRVYNNEWDEPEIYMTLYMYSGLFAEKIGGEESE